MLSHDAASSSPLSVRFPRADALGCSDNKTQAASTTTPIGPRYTTTRKILHSGLNVSQRLERDCKRLHGCRASWRAFARGRLPTCHPPARAFQKCPRASSSKQGARQQLRARSQARPCRHKTQIFVALRRFLTKHHPSSFFAAPSASSRHIGFTLTSSTLLPSFRARLSVGRDSTIAHAFTDRSCDVQRCVAQCDTALRN